MLEPDASATEDVYGVRQLQSELRDGDSAFREIVRILMDEDNPPDDDRGPRPLSQQSYSHDEGWRSQEYAQLIRDAIFCLSFLAVLLSVLILIILRSNKINRHPSVSTQGVGGGGGRQSNKVTSGGDKSQASQKSTKSKFRASLKSTVVRVGGETRLGEERSKGCGDISIV